MLTAISHNFDESSFKRFDNNKTIFVEKKNYFIHNVIAVKHNESIHRT